MKTFAVLIVFTVFGFVVNGQPPYYDQDFKTPAPPLIDSLEGIKAITLYRLVLPSSSIDKELKRPGRIFQRVEFDEEKRPTLRNYYENAGSIIYQKYTYTYPNDNEIFIEFFGGQGKIYHTWLLRDSVVHESHHYTGKKRKLQATWKYTYRKDTLLTNFKKFDENKELEYETRAEYTEFDKPERITYFSQRLGTSYVIHSYDQNENLIGQEERSNSEDLITKAYELERDSTDQVVSVEAEGDVGKEARWVYEYNDAGDKKQTKIFSSSGRLLRTITYEYDENGELAKTSDWKMNREKYRYLYKHDSEGNLTSRDTYERSMGELLQTGFYKVSRNARGDYDVIQFYDGASKARIRIDYEYEFYE